MFRPAKSAARLAIDRSLQAWVELYAQIITKAGKVIGGYVDGKPNPEQFRPNILQQRLDEAVIWCLENGVPIRILALKPRQKGCSTYIISALYWLIRKFTFQACIIGGKLKQVRNLWNMLRRYCSADHHDWPNSGEVGATEAKFTHGATVIKETAKDAEAGRSGTIHVLVCTEAARWSEYGVANAEEVLNGIENCVPYVPNSAEFLETTARGPSGPFYDRWSTKSYTLEEFKKRHANGTLNGITFIKVFAGWHEFEESWTDPLTGEPVALTLDQRRHLKNTMTDHEREMMQEHGVKLEQLVYYRRTLLNECQGDLEKMKREFPTTPEEAFSASIDSRFDKEGLAAMRQYANTQKDANIVGMLENPRGDNKTYAFVPEEAGTLIVNEGPVPKCQYSVIVDPATGECMTEGDDPDCHGIIVYRRGYLDRDRGWQRSKIVACNLPEDRRDADVAAEDVYRLAKYYGNCPIIVEANKDPGFIVLLKRWGANLYERETPDAKKRQKRTGIYGFMTKPGDGPDGNRRRNIIDMLAAQVREHGEDEYGIDCPFLHIIQEMTTFVNYPDGKPRALEGCHDDFVMALAIGHRLEEVCQPYRKQSLHPELPGEMLRANKRGKRNRPGKSKAGYL